MISRFGAPFTDTVPTPETLASGVATRSSRILSRALTLWSAVQARIMIGMSSALNLKMVGLVAPSGREDFIMSSLSRTSLVATSISTPYWNSSVSRDTFSRDDEVTSLRLATELREFSSSLVRLVSTSSALAPG